MSTDVAVANTSSPKESETSKSTERKSGFAAQLASQSSGTESSSQASGQSAARQTTSSGTEGTGSQQANSKLPWQQQSAASTQTTEAGQPISKEQELKRVIIDPATGLYIETTLGINNLGESDKMSFENRQEDMIEWSFWDLEGRIGLSVEKDSYNGSLTWEQEGDKLDFRFRGPLGFGGVRIHGDLSEEVWVKTTRGEEFFLQDIEVDMQSHLGWSMPINSLRFWSLGITDPEQDAEVVLNENDLLDELMQGDWKVVYEEYMDVDGVMMPRKFKINGPKTKIKMLINEWVIPGSE